MMKIEKLVPKRRFKEFQNTEAWEQCKLADVSKIKTGPFGSTLHAEDYVSDGTPIITTEHFKHGKLPINKKNTPQVSKEDVIRLKSYVLKIDDIVFSRVGSVDINALVEASQDGWLFSGRVLRVRSDELTDSQFLHYELSTTRVKNNVVARAVGQTMPSINTVILKETKIFSPSKNEEQIKVGTFFKQLDDTIALLQRQLEKIKSLKTAYLSEMFPVEGEKRPKRRFKGFTDDWKQRNLRDISEISTGFPFRSTDFKDSGEYLVITNSNIQDNQNIVVSNVGNHIDIDSDVKLKNYILNIDDILVTMDGTVGRTAKVVAIKQVLAQRVGRLASKEDSEFLYQWLNTGDFYNDMTKISHGGTIKHISLSEIGDYCALIPSMAEQIKIGKFFNNFDNTISLHQHKLEKLQNLKKAYLNEMFV